MRVRKALASSLGWDWVLGSVLPPARLVSIWSRWGLLVFSKGGQQHQTLG